jgi:hypothetical protein
MKTFCYALIAVVMFANPLMGQAPAPPAPAAAPKPTPSPAPRPPAPPGPPAQLVNIRVDVVVIEEGGTAAPVRKTASVITSDRRAAAVRSIGDAERGEPKPPDARFPNPRTVTFMKADVEPYIERNGLIRTQVIMEYLSPTSQQEGRGTTLRFEPLLENGKPLRVSESTDPTSNRKVIVEVTATILK